MGMFSPITAELDESGEALRNVDKITDSEPVNGEDLFSSPDLKRQLREAKERLKSESANKPRLGHNEGVRKMVAAERKAVVGSPDLESHDYIAH